MALPFALAGWTLAHLKVGIDELTSPSLGERRHTLDMGIL